MDRSELAEVLPALMIAARRSSKLLLRLDHNLLIILHPCIETFCITHLHFPYACLLWNALHFSLCYTELLQQWCITSILEIWQIWIKNILIMPCSAQIGLHCTAHITLGCKPPTLDRLVQYPYSLALVWWILRILIVLSRILDAYFFKLSFIWQGLRCCRKWCKFCQQNSDASQDALTLVHNSSFEGQHAKDSEYV